MKKIIAASCLTVALPLVSAAHPGHGTTDGFTITHYFTEPVHVVVSLSIIVAAAVYIRYRSSKQKETN
jgi:hypothetical protein